MVILAPIAAMLVQMAISRTREYAADGFGGRIGGQRYALASALVKISNAAHQTSENDTAEQNPATAHLFIINPLRRAGWWTACSRPILRPKTGSSRCKNWRPEMGQRPGLCSRRGVAGLETGRRGRARRERPWGTEPALRLPLGQKSRSTPNGLASSGITCEEAHEQ